MQNFSIRFLEFYDDKWRHFDDNFQTVIINISLFLQDIKIKTKLAKNITDPSNDRIIGPHRVLGSNLPYPKLFFNVNSI